MDPRVRDGLLAAGSLGVLVAAAVGLGPGGVLSAPLPAVVGVAGSLVLEAAFLRYPERVRAVWERPPVQVAGAAAVVLGGGLGTLVAGPWVLAALVWGLLAYLALLGLVLAGLGNPLAPLVGAPDRAESDE